MRYKRNQVEEAIAASLRRGGAEPSSDLRVRIKRLLEGDRAATRTASEGPGADVRSAFYTGEAPGSGSEVWFSGYEVFALLIGLLLQQHRWPQGTVVQIMRHARRVLEREHGRILTRDRGALFDEAEVERRAAPGMIAVGNVDPVFLAIVSTGRSEENKTDLAPHAVRVCHGDVELTTFMRERASGGLGSTTVLELVTPAHLLAEQLSQTSPKLRGPKGR